MRVPTSTRLTRPRLHLTASTATAELSSPHECSNARARRPRLLATVATSRGSGTQRPLWIPLVLRWRHAVTRAASAAIPPSRPAWQEWLTNTHLHFNAVWHVRQSSLRPLYLRFANVLRPIIFRTVAPDLATVSIPWPAATRLSCRWYTATPLPIWLSGGARGHIVSPSRNTASSTVAWPSPVPAVGARRKPIVDRRSLHPSDLGIAIQGVHPVSIAPRRCMSINPTLAAVWQRWGLAPAVAWIASPLLTWPQKTPDRAGWLVDVDRSSRLSLRSVELVWRKSPTDTAVLKPGEPAGIPLSSLTPPATPGRSPNAARTTAQVLATNAPIGMKALDPALADRLADDVVRRIERRLRIERERRGI